MGVSAGQGPTPSRIMTHREGTQKGTPIERKVITPPASPTNKTMHHTRLRLRTTTAPLRLHQPRRVGHEFQSEARPLNLVTHQSRNLQSINNQPTPNIQLSTSSDVIKSTTLTPDIQQPTATSDATEAEHETTEKPATQSQPCIT